MWAPLVVHVPMKAQRMLYSELNRKMVDQRRLTTIGQAQERGQRPLVE
jgi:hypothetical protein